ncbi:carboxypeptidase-like regulatory domain-containing protein [Desulfurivibrio sp. D14AmB]|uniref:carboxypeptidase-like regulatory domain-containing protein n=1 Tax=Desulfurivibrio sp. D14AmB TaxID=3374370 RepID=UPI00376EA41A
MGTGRKFIICASLLHSALLLNGCAGPTTIRVLDAETKEPIEGAVAIAMWYRTKGLPGLSSTYTAKVVEAESDADGFFRIPGVAGTLALQKPHLKVYKPGYVGWDSKLIYLGRSEKNPTIPVYERRETFAMKDQDLYLEPWREEYTHVSHELFLSIPGDKIDLSTSKYLTKIHDYEAPRSQSERKLRRERMK